MYTYTQSYSKKSILETVLAVLLPLKLKQNCTQYFNYFFPLSNCMESDLAENNLLNLFTIKRIVIFFRIKIQFLISTSQNQL